MISETRSDVFHDCEAMGGYGATYWRTMGEIYHYGLSVKIWPTDG